jgi:hypothetical protein
MQWQVASSKEDGRRKPTVDSSTQLIEVSSKQQKEYCSVLEPNYSVDLNLPPTPKLTLTLTATLSLTILSKASNWALVQLCRFWYTINCLDVTWRIYASWIRMSPDDRGSK